MSAYLKAWRHMENSSRLPPSSEEIERAISAAKASTDPAERGHHVLSLIWTALLKHNVLTDGMKFDDAVALMGPPTDSRIYQTRGDSNGRHESTRVHWYHNYRGWHVFPDLSARNHEGRLYDFRIGIR